ncbi:alanine racemase [Pasteurella multocida subsp. multocida str. Anand1_buffalo]|nr:alanine racemase [Pasteurella multocida subsp. multocida str. Anand1_buffalo]
MDTGMHRLGVALEDVEYFYQALRDSENVDPQIGFVSHFSRADELECDYTKLQLTTFLNATQNKAGEKVLLPQVGSYFGKIPI